MTNIWEKVISILAWNLNLGRSYLITTVLVNFLSWSFEMTKNPKLRLTFFNTSYLVKFEIALRVRKLITFWINVNKKQNPHFGPQAINFLKTVSYEANLTSQLSHLEVLLQIKFGSLLFRLALAILCTTSWWVPKLISNPSFAMTSKKL